MDSATLNQQLDTLIGMTDETATVEFKSNLKEEKEIGNLTTDLSRRKQLIENVGAQRGPGALWKIRQSPKT